MYWSMVMYSRMMTYSPMVLYDEPRRTSLDQLAVNTYRLEQLEYDSQPRGTQLVNHEIITA
jgi:hypothetical protein